MWSRWVLCLSRRFASKHGPEKWPINVTQRASKPHPEPGIAQLPL